MLKRLFYMPEVASDHGPQIDFVNDMVHWLMLVLFIGWGLFFIIALFKFRAGANHRANYHGARSHASTYMEVGVAVVEAVLLIGFAMPLWADRMDEAPDEKDSTVVRVVAEQFVWNMHYPGADGKFGSTSVDAINLETNPLGLDRTGDGADDITTINQLHLPVDKPVIIHVSSKDVIHSFNLPHMRIKQDTIPGLTIPLWFVPTVTTDEMRQRLGDDEFMYEIACAQLCGLGHSTMRGFLTVHTDEGYAAWLAEEATYLGSGDEDDFWD
jgi:cytochrome c oxidase subunit 2